MACSVAIGNAVWSHSISAGMHVNELGVELKGKTVLLTGAGGRLGFPLAVAAVRAGATLVATARSSSSASEIKTRLDAELQGREGQVETLVLDLSDFEHVRLAAAEFRERHQVLDVLIHNATTHGLDSQLVTADGFNPTMAVNLLAPALLTDLLLPALRLSQSARILNLGSANCYDLIPGVDEARCEDVLAWFRGQRLPTGVHSYGLSKFLSIHYFAALAVRHSALTVFSVNPGVFRCDTESEGSATVAKIAARLSEAGDEGQEALLEEARMQYCTNASLESLNLPFLQWRPFPQTAGQSAAVVLFAAAQPDIEMASGALLDFATEIRSTWPENEPRWVQSGETGIPRPLPPWSGDCRAELHELVQSLVGASSEK